MGVASGRAHATIHDMDENATATPWRSPENFENPALAGGRWLEVGREHTWFVSSLDETWRASGTHGNREFVKMNMQVPYAAQVFEGWRLGLGHGVVSSTCRGLSNPVRLG